MITETKCPSCGRKKTRSSEQNKRYWKLLSLLAEKVIQGTKYESESWHEYFKFKFLGADDIKLPNGKVIVRAKSTTELDVSEFNEFMTQVEVWCNDRDIYLED